MNPQDMGTTGLVRWVAEAKGFPESIVRQIQAENVLLDRGYVEEQLKRFNRCVNTERSKTAKVTKERKPRRIKAQVELPKGFVTCLGCSAWPSVCRRGDGFWQAHCATRSCASRPVVATTETGLRTAWNEQHARVDGGVR